MKTANKKCEKVQLARAISSNYRYSKVTKALEQVSFVWRGAFSSQSVEFSTGF